MMATHTETAMTDREWLELNERATSRVPRWEIAMLILLALGVVGFFLGLGGDHRSLQAFWINFLFWGGIAQACVVFAAMVFVTRGQWGPTVARLALLQVAFLPITLVLFVLIALMSPTILPWADAAAQHAIHEEFGFKALWLSVPFFIVRDFAALLLLAAVSIAFALTVMRPERGAMAELRGAPLPRGWRGLEAERALAFRRGMGLAIALIFLYAVGFSLIAFDMVMSLEFHWYSTMFGGYFFLTAVFMGLAALILWATILRRRLGLERQLGPSQFHNTGKILLGFCILSAYTWFAQYLVIWYGDLPEEVSFIVRRVDQHVWLGMGLVTIFGGFVIPFICLLSQRLKMIPPLFSVLAALILLVGFTERTLLVLPALRQGVTSFFPGVIGPTEILVTLGFLGLYGLAYLWSLRRGILVPPDWKLPPLAY